jgi:hypothetical protein
MAVSASELSLNLKKSLMIEMNVKEKLISVCSDKMLFKTVQKCAEWVITEVAKHTRRTGIEKC